MAKSNDKKSPLMPGLIFSLILHGTLVFIIIFRGFNSPAIINKQNIISGRIVTLGKAGNPGSPVSSNTSQEMPKPVEKKSPPEPKKAEKPKQAPKETPKEPEPVVKTEPKEKPKPEEKKVEKEVVKPKPEEKNVVDISEKKKPVKKKPPEKREEPKPVKPAVSKEDTEKKRQEFLNQLQNKKSKEDILSELKRDTEKTKVADADTNSDSNSYDITSPKGNTSASSGINSAMVSLYADAVGREIASNWNIPPNIPTDGRLLTKVFFRSNESGEVFDLRIEESSGNTSFDEFCLRAIKKASPLKTPPPPEILEQTKTEGIEVSFKNDPS